MMCSRGLEDDYTATTRVKFSQLNTLHGNDRAQDQERNFQMLMCDLPQRKNTLKIMWHHNNKYAIMSMLTHNN